MDIGFVDVAPAHAAFGSVRIRAVSSSRPTAALSGSASDGEITLLVSLDRPPSIRGIVSEKGPCVASLQPGQASAVAQPAAKCQLAVTFPSRVLHGVGIDEPVNLALDVHSALFWPFLTFAWTCATTGDRHTGLTLYFMERLLQEMIVGVVVASLRPRNERATSDLYSAALSIIAARVGDPDLTAASVALELNASLRTLQRQFSSRGATIDRSIRRARVRHATSLLEDPAYATLSVEQISHTCGLANGSSLARAFAAEGQPPPAAVRAFGRRAGAHT